MTEKQGKTRLYKVAKEYNLSHDVLIEFLAKKGFEVKNHMSVIDQDMMDLLEKHYKKEKSDAERHAKKKKEYDEIDRKRRGEPKDEETEEVKKPSVEVPDVTQTEVEEIPEPARDEATPADVEPVVEEEQPFVEKVQPEVPEPPAEVSVEPVMEIEPVEPPDVPEAETVETEPETETIEAIATPEEKETGPTEEPAGKKGRGRPKKSETEEFDVSIQASMPRMGLTVKGKIELTPPRERGKKTDGRDAAKKGKDKEPTRRDSIGTGSTVVLGSLLEESPKHKKKKKKKAPLTKEGTSEPVDSESAKARAAKKGKKTRGHEIDAADVDDAIKRTKASMADFSSVSQRAQMRKKKRAKREEVHKRELERVEQEKRVLKIYEYASVNELSNLMNVSVGELISSLINLGVMASINQRLDMDTITLVASEFGFEIQAQEEDRADMPEDAPDQEELLVERPPIVTIMGHVDHGKTSLLDKIRNTNVVAGESGGITQHIGAYTVTLPDNRKITFLDTPGHEAFTAMRARGAQVTDIVVLVVAADDNVMPQTVEAISHALAAKVPIVVAINKIDKPEANIERIKQQLADRNILVEDWGGRYGAVPLSAKAGVNIEVLLERILLESDVLTLKANPKRLARGIVIESLLDKGKGVIATVLVQKGTLRVGDPFVAGNEFGKVRAMLDERGNRVDEATPAIPVQVLGFNGLPQAGDVFASTPTDREARDLAIERQQIKRESEFRRMRRATLDDISAQIKIGGVQDLRLIVKADMDGSVEALSDSLMRLSTQEVRVEVIHKGVGAISESDVLLASASEAIIIGFHVRPNLNARRLAETEEVDIRLYEIIYDAIGDVKKALEGMLRPDVTERVTASVLVRDTFKISKVGTIAGCYVQEGRIQRNNRVRLLRDGIVVFMGNIDSLKRFKDDAREVDTGFECGISLENFNDIKVGDVIEAFERVETKRTLE